MNSRNKQKIQHEISKLIGAIANTRSREHYDVLDESKQGQGRRNIVIICVSMAAGIFLGIAATILLNQHFSMKQYSLPTPDIETLAPTEDENLPVNAAPPSYQEFIENESARDINN